MKASDIKKGMFLQSFITDEDGDEHNGIGGTVTEIQKIDDYRTTFIISHEGSVTGSFDLDNDAESGDTWDVVK